MGVWVGLVGLIAVRLVTCGWRFQAGAGRLSARLALEVAPTLARYPVCMATTAQSVAEVCARAKAASRELAALDTATKNAALEAMADALERAPHEILEANARDMEAGEEAGLHSGLLDRLKLTEERLAGIAADVRKIAALPDPVGETIDGHRLENGLDVRRVRVPLGVVAVVYEARPNVTVDCSALCLKSGNAIVLRGSSTAAHSNAVLAQVAAGAVQWAGCPTARSRSSAAATATSCASSRPRTAWST